MLAPVSLSSLPSLPSPLSSPLPKHASPALHLVLLPGMDGTGQLFAPLLAALQDLTPELPVSVVPYSDQLPTDQQLQVSLHHRLKHGAKTVILAESFSGHVLTRLLHNWPAQLGPQPIGLVMAGSFVRNPQRWAGPLRAVARAVLPPILPPLMQVVTRDSRDSPAPSPHPLLRTLARVLYGPQPAPEHCAALRNALAQVPPALMVARVQAVLACDETRAWQALRVPTLVLSAQRDQLVPPAETARMLALRPNCQHIALPGPHGLLQTQPVAAAQAIVGFVQTLARETAFT
jgi:pimeloyl-ACP methyl ester carboxylesterase